MVAMAAKLTGVVRQPFRLEDHLVKIVKAVVAAIELTALVERHPSHADNSSARPLVVDESWLLVPAPL
jgi:hypothetical protein